MSTIYRNPVTKEIDVKSSLQAFAEKLISMKSEEQRIRSNRRYRNAVKAVLDENKGTSFRRGNLARAALNKLRVKDGDRSKTLDELWDHINLNRQHGYLRMVDNTIW